MPREPQCGLGLRPLPQQVVVHPSQLHHGIAVGCGVGEFGDGGVHLKQGAALAFITNQALNPHKSGQACALGNGCHTVQAG